MNSDTYSTYPQYGNPYWNQTYNQTLENQSDTQFFRNQAYAQNFTDQADNPEYFPGFDPTENNGWNDPNPTYQTYNQVSDDQAYTQNFTHQAYAQTFTDQSDSLESFPRFNPTSGFGWNGSNPTYQTYQQNPIKRFNFSNLSNTYREQAFGEQAFDNTSLPHQKVVQMSLNQIPMTQMYDTLSKVPPAPLIGIPLNSEKSFEGSFQTILDSVQDDFKVDRWSNEGIIEAHKGVVGFFEKKINLQEDLNPTVKKIAVLAGKVAAGALALLHGVVVMCLANPLRSLDRIIDGYLFIYNKGKELSEKEKFDFIDGHTFCALTFPISETILTIFTVIAVNFADEADVKGLLTQAYPFTLRGSKADIEELEKKQEISL